MAHIRLIHMAKNYLSYFPRKDLPVVCTRAPFKENSLETCLSNDWTMDLLLNALFVALPFVEDGQMSRRRRRRRQRDVGDLIARLSSHSLS